MNHAQLRGLLLPRGRAHQQDCVKLSATRHISAADWKLLKNHQQEYLRCYAAAAAAHTAILVGRSAARVGGLWVIPQQPEMIELAQSSGHPPSKKQWPASVTYHHMPVAEQDIAELTLDDGTGHTSLRITRHARTIVDIARLHGLRHGVVALDSWLSGETPMNVQERLRSIESVINRLAGKKGIATARRVLALGTRLSESPYESLLRVILAEHGIVAEPQMWIGTRTRVDLLWGQLVIEVDGLSKYEDVPHETVIKQLKRENWLREQGYEVVRIFAADILRNENRCVQRIREAKERADSRGAVRVRATPQRPF